MENVVTREQATLEFERWAFEIKKIKPRLIDEDAKESVIQNIVDGTFSIDENGNVIQKLAFPLSDYIHELKFKPRMQVFEMSKMKQYKNGDDTGKTAALIAVLTDQNKGVIEKLDSIDFVAAGALLAFYMVG